MKYVNGDLIELALKGKFDVITHGVNCFCNMGSGIAVPMSRIFDANEMPLEQRGKGDYNKLGTIEHHRRFIGDDGSVNLTEQRGRELYVVNAYTQYSPGRWVHGPSKIPLDYEALRMCFRKINFTFKGKHVGIPTIGCGLAKGDIKRVTQIIDEECTDVEVTMVIWDKNN